MSLKKAPGRIIPQGWLRQFLKRDAKGITGNLDKLFHDCAVDIFGKDKVDHQEKGYWSSWWAGETQGNWMEALIRLAFVLNDAKLLKRASAMVENILANQSEDGYIGIYKEGARYVVTKRFGELWTQSRAMRSLLCYYDHTQDERVKTALLRMADNILDNVKESVFEIADEDGSKGHSLMIIDGMYRLYLMTGEAKYRDFCVWLYDDYCAHISQFIQDDLRSSNVLNPDVPFVGHGPHTCEMLRLPLLLYRMTGKDHYLIEYLCAVKKLNKNLSLSGSCKSDEFIGTYQSSLVMENDERTSVFGGSIPLPTAAYEYCSTTELALDYISAEHILEDVSYADRLEWLVYNAGLASKHPSGKMIQYLGADNMYDASHTVNPRYDYSPTHDDAAVCCAPNACKLMPAVTEEAFLMREEVLIANLFLPVRFEFMRGANRMTIEEKTEYPFNYNVTFTVHGKSEFPFAFRLPAYATAFTVRKNGKECAYEKHCGLVYLLDRISGGDVIELVLSSEVTIHRAVDGTFALSYGTLLFSKDIPAECKRYRKYEGVSGFYDCDFIPVLHEDWNYTILTKDAVTCEEAEIEYTGAEGYPLDETPIVLSVRALDRYAYPVQLKLVPIGATTLRRTTFPVYTDEDKIYRR